MSRLTLPAPPPREPYYALRRTHERGCLSLGCMLLALTSQHLNTQVTWVQTAVVSASHQVKALSLNTAAGFMWLETVVSPWDVAMPRGTATSSPASSLRTCWLCEDTGPGSLFFLSSINCPRTPCLISSSR